MADFCLFCNKKIGLLGKLTSKTYAEGAICGSCVERFNDALYVYYQTTDGYTLDQLRIVHPRIPELLSYRAKLKEIDSKYYDFIAPVKSKLQSRESDFSMMSRDSEKELQKFKQEAERDIQETIREDGRYSRTTKEFIQDVTKGIENMEKSTQLIMEEAKEEIEYLKSMISINDRQHSCERFAYTFKFVPAEKDLFGFVGKDETLSKSLAEVVDTIKYTISVVLDRTTYKNFNLSELSYQQLAHLYYNYIEIMGNWNIELVKAEGMVKCQSLSLKASEVWGDSKDVESAKERYYSLADDLKKCEANCSDCLDRLRKRCVSFLDDVLSAKNQPQNDVHTLKSGKTVLPVAQPISPRKEEPADSPFHKGDQPSLSASSSYGDSHIGNILKTIVARNAFTDIGIICQNGLPINNDKADKARISFGIPDVDDIYFIASGQMMGGISETSKGFAITTSGIFYRKNGREQGFYDWELFSSIRISSNTFTYIEIGAVELQVSGQRKVLELLLDLQREIRNNLSDIVVIPQPSVPQKADESRAIPAQQAIPKKIETTEPVEKAPAAETTTVKESSSEIICPSCNKANKSTARFCNYCGSPLLEETRFCTQCGAKLRPGKKFCSGCGAKIE